MFASTLLVATDRRIRAYLIGGLAAVMVVVGSVAYEVQRGDTLSAIAAAHGVSVEALLEVNDIADPDLILVGQEIVIPGEDGEAARIHVVGNGDTLGRIASDYDSSAEAIAEANALSDPNVIRVGQELKIPGTGPGGTTSSAEGFHIVEAGETLSSIAAQHGISVAQLAEANGITETSVLYVGARLSFSGSTYVSEATETGGSSVHTVGNGETLGTIASHYGVSISELASTNGIGDVNSIRVGAELRVPSGGGGWVCPVPGGQYVNDWGFPRNGGRFHEGNDLFAPRGTKVLAPVGGDLQPVSGDVGGFQFYLYGDDGTTYIGTHLDAFGRSGRVEAGQTIGYVGDTGNARGGPTHLHFEVHPGDGEAVNPYPTLQAAGC